MCTADVDIFFKYIVCKEDRIVHCISGCGQHHGQFEWQVQYLLHTIDTLQNDYSCSATAAAATAAAQTPYVSNDFFTNRYQLRMNAPVSFIARPTILHRIQYDHF